MKKFYVVVGLWKRCSVKGMEADVELAWTLRGMRAAITQLALSQGCHWPIMLQSKFKAGTPPQWMQSCAGCMVGV